VAGACRGGNEARGAAWHRPCGPAAWLGQSQCLHCAAASTLSAVALCVPLLPCPLTGFCSCQHSSVTSAPRGSIWGQRTETAFQISGSLTTAQHMHTTGERDMAAGYRTSTGHWPWGPDTALDFWYGGHVHAEGRLPSFPVCPPLAARVWLVRKYGAYAREGDVLGAFLVGPMQTWYSCRRTLVTWRKFLSLRGLPGLCHGFMRYLGSTQSPVRSLQLMLSTESASGTRIKKETDSGFPFQSCF
jgi:hypothetical protein